MTELSHVFGQRMVKQRSGHILLVASIAAYQPTPLVAAYGAAKPYVRSLGEALHVEMAPAVGVTVLSPGVMDTEFLETAKFTPNATVRRSMVAPAKVANVGLDATCRQGQRGGEWTQSPAHVRRAVAAAPDTGPHRLSHGQRQGRLSTGAVMAMSSTFYA